MLVQIETQGLSYYLKVPDDLNHSELTSQLWWILKQNPKTEMEFEAAYYQSQIWRAQKYHQAVYPSQVQAAIKAQTPKDLE